MFLLERQAVGLVRASCVSVSQMIDLPNPAQVVHVEPCVARSRPFCRFAAMPSRSSAQAWPPNVPYEIHIRIMRYVVAHTAGLATTGHAHLLRPATTYTAAQ